MSDGKLAGLHQRHRGVHHCGRQKAAKGDNWRQVKATNCDKFIAAFCRFLSLGFEPRFFRTISLGDGVFIKLPADKGKTNARYLH